MKFMLLRITVIVVLGFLAFGSMLPAPFRVMDDRISIIENPLIKSLHNAPEIFQEGYFHDNSYYRPLINLSFMLEYHFFGLNSFFYNLDNLLLHVLNGVLVFVLVLMLVANMDIAFWAGVLFVLHPVQWEAVCNVPGRAILLNAFFELSTLILFLKYYKDRRWFYLPLMFVSFLGALLCKESAGVLPLVIVGYLFLQKDAPWPQKLQCLWPMLAALAGYVFLRKLFGITQLHSFDEPGGRLLGFVTFLRSVITDLRLFILPLDLHDDRSLPLIHTLFSHRAVWTLGFWAVVLGAISFNYRKINAFAWFLIAWFAIELLPVSQLVTSIQVGQHRISSAEHFLYLASIPVFIGMVLFFRRIYIYNRALKFLAGGFLAFLLLTSVEQSIYASSEFGLVNRSLQFDAGNPRLQGELGLLYVFRGNFPLAQEHFELAIKSDPFNPKYHIALGTTFGNEGRWIESLEQFVALDPGDQKSMVKAQEKLTMGHLQDQLAQGQNFDSKGWLAMGIYAAQQGDNKKALEAFAQSAALNPKQVDAWFNMASINDAEHHWAQAKIDFETLLTMNNLSVFQKDFALKHLASKEYN